MLNETSPALSAAFAVVCALLVIKAQLLGAATAAARGRLKRFVNEEDAAWLGGDQVERDGASVERVSRAHRNDLENLVPFFVGGALYVWGKGPASVGMVYFIAFLGARFAHSFAYLGRRPMLRRNTYTAGWLVTIVLAAHAAWNLGRAALS